MRGVLVGADLMYRQDGKIVPVELNTNVAWESSNRMEKEEDVFDLSDLKQYIADHHITDVFLEGRISRIAKFWTEDMGAEFHIIWLEDNAQYTPEENDNYLYIRTSYSDEAYVDNFCRDKVNFLRAIKDRPYGCEYILKTAEGLEGEITHLEDNGDYPNFVVKYRYPFYDTSVYPMFVRFETLEQLNAWVDENLEDDFFIMPFYFNEEKGMWNDSRLKLIRNWSVWVATGEGTLDSIYIGQYTKLTAELSGEILEWDENGNAVDQQKVHKLFNTKGWERGEIRDVLADADDVILMEDDTWKTVEDLQVGDRVKAVTIPTEGDVDIREHVGDYNIPLSQLEAESEFTINEVKSKSEVEGWFNETVMYFTDGTDWYDSDESSYPVLDPEDETVMFKEIKDLVIGDQVILMPIGSAHLQKPEFVVKEVERLEHRRTLQKGYSLGLDGNHLFLSRTSEDAEAYISIEHNADQSVQLGHTQQSCSSGTTAYKVNGGTVICGTSGLISCFVNRRSNKLTCVPSSWGTQCNRNIVAFDNVLISQENYTYCLQTN